MSERCCGTCLFFAPNGVTRGEIEYGRCRRYPPVIARSTDVPNSEFPMIASAAWCGEWKETEIERLKKFMADRKRRAEILRGKE